MKPLFRTLLRKVGLEMRRYAPARSDLARIELLLSHHRINLVLDVGANAGQYARMLREIGYAGRIVSFEPLAQAHAKLLEASKDDPGWAVAPRGAIGSRSGEATLHVSRNSFSSSTLPMLDAHLRAAPDSAYVGTEHVAISSLDAAARPYIDAASDSIYLKIDVQGTESEVLAGAEAVLPSVRGVQVELSLMPLYEGEPLFRDMLDRMDRLGYDLHAVVPGFTDERTGRLLQMDGIFFRK